MILNKYAYVVAMNLILSGNEDVLNDYRNELCDQMTADICGWGINE